MSNKKNPAPVDSTELRHWSSMTGCISRLSHVLKKNNKIHTMDARWRKQDDGWFSEDAHRRRLVKSLCFDRRHSDFPKTYWSGQRMLKQKGSCTDGAEMCFSIQETPSSHNLMASKDQAHRWLPPSPVTFVHLTVFWYLQVYYLITKRSQREEPDSCTEFLS